MRDRLYKALTALAVFASALLFLEGIGHAGAPEGRQIFTARNCSVCHETKPPQKATIEKALEEKGPALWYAGDKFRKEFLTLWLSNPKPIRPMAYNSMTRKNRGEHPALKAAGASDVAEYLMTLKAPGMKTADIKPGATPRGRFIFQKKLGCYGCHRFKSGGRVIGGVTGATLEGASKRLQPDWIYAYLSNPAVFTPVTPMPDYSGSITDSEMKALAEYVSGLE